jgi:hypothetical protein
VKDSTGGRKTGRREEGRGKREKREEREEDREQG